MNAVLPGWSGADALVTALRRVSTVHPLRTTRNIVNLSRSCCCLATYCQQLHAIPTTAASSLLQVNYSKALSKNKSNGPRCRVLRTAVATAAPRSPYHLSWPPPSEPMGTTNQSNTPTATSLYAELRQYYDAGMAPPTGVCNSQLRGVCKSGKWNEVWRCYRLAEAAGAHVELQTFEVLWQQALQLGHVAHALGLFRRMVRLHGPASQRSYVTLVSRLLKVRRRGVATRQLAYQAWLELKAAHKATLDAASFRAGVNVCLECGHMEESEALLRVMRERGLRPGHGVHNMMIKYHCRRGDMEAARGAFKAMRVYYRPDIVTYNTLVSGYVQQGDVVRARAVIDKARYEGCPPDAWSYSMYLKACMKAGDLQRVDEALVEMRQAGVATTPHIYGALVDGYMRKGDTAAAEAAVGSMVEAGLQPNAVIYNTLIRGHCKLGFQGQARALQLLAEMQAAGILADVDTFATLIDAAAEGGDAQQVPALLRQMRTEGLVPDAVVCTTLMMWYSRQERYDDALQVFEEMMANGGAGASILSGVWDRRSGSSTSQAAQTGSTASAVVPSLPLAPHVVDTVGPVGQAVSSSGSSGGNANGSTSNGSVVYSTSSTSTTATAPRPVSNHSRAGPAPAPTSTTATSSSSSSTWSSSMSDPSTWGIGGPDVVALCALVSVHATSGAMEEAEAVARAAVDLAARSGLPPPAGAFGALVKGYYQRDMLQPALNAFRALLQLGGKPNRRMLDRVVELSVKAGDYGTAYQAVRAAQLTGAQLTEADRQRYRDLLSTWQARDRSWGGGQRGSSGNSGSSNRRDFDGGPINRALERFKWWLGLPNSYYSSDWR